MTRIAISGRAGMVLAAAAACVSGTALTMPARPVMAAPEPDAVPRRWELDVKFGALRLAQVQVGDQVRSYYYLTYRVTNRSGQDLLLAPSFELATDDGDVRRSGRDVPPEVTKKVLEHLENPFMQDQLSILGMILQGDENAKDGVVIWPAETLASGEVSIYGAGFSGETKMVEVKDVKTGKPTQVPVRKTYMARYRLPGDITNRGGEPLDPSEQRWIMR